jgi:hypothetical protein
MIQDRNTLKSYFEEGSDPTEEQFASLIDSFAHLNEDSAQLGLGIYDSGREYPSGICVIYEGLLYISNSATTGGAWDANKWDLVESPIRVARFATAHVFEPEDVGRIIGINNGLAIPYAETDTNDVEATVEIPVSIFEEIEFRPAVSASKSSAFITIVSWLASKESQLSLVVNIDNINVVIVAGDQVAEDADEAAAAAAIANYLNTNYGDFIVADNTDEVLSIETVGTGLIYNAASLKFEDEDDENEVLFTGGSDGYAATTLSWVNGFDMTPRVIVAGVDVMPQASAEGTVDEILEFINTEFADFSAVRADGMLKISYQEPGALTNIVSLTAYYEPLSDSYAFAGGSSAGTFSFMTPLGKLVRYGEDFVEVEDSEFVECEASDTIEMSELMFPGLTSPAPVRVVTGGTISSWRQGDVLFGWVFQNVLAEDQVYVKKQAPF